MDWASFWIGAVVGFSACVIFIFLSLILVVLQVIKPARKARNQECPDQQ